MVMWRWQHSLLVSTMITALYEFYFILWVFHVFIYFCFSNNFFLMYTFIFSFLYQGNGSERVVKVYDGQKNKTVV